MIILANKLQFNVNAAEQVNIDSSGNADIGRIGVAIHLPI